MDLQSSFPAGIPLEAIEDIIGWEEIPYEWTRGDKESIQRENNKISKETGKRRRHTTSDRLKMLKNEAISVSNKIEILQEIEDQLMDLLPQWVISRVVKMENK